MLIRRAFEILRPSQRRRMLGLVPFMLIASLFELSIVASAAGFFTLLNDISTLEGHNPIATMYRMTGLSPSGFLVASGLAVLVTVVVGNAFAGFVNRRVFVVTGDQVVDIGTRSLEGHMHEPFEYFLVHSYADLNHRVIADVGQVVSGVIVAATMVGVRLVSAFAIAAFLLWQEPLVTMVLVLSMLSIYGLSYLAVKRALARLGERATIAARRVNRVGLEGLRGAKEIKLLGLERTAVEQFRDPSAEYERLRATLKTIRSLTKYFLDTAGVGGLVFVVVIFIAMGRDVTQILPVVATFAIAAFRMLPTFHVVFQFASNIQAHSYPLQNVWEDVHRIEHLPPAVDGAPVELRERITLQGIDYRYPRGDKRVLRDISLEVERGTWVAVVGSTGAGKSTLVDLLMGLLAPQAGEIRIDGAPLITTADFRGWQRNIGYVPQMMFVTDDTIARNIAFGDAEPDLERVRWAARLAELSAFVESELPDGYETRVGDFGTRLSGGQRQRMGIARALYRKPAVLVLDEATSALDNHTEARVMANLREHFSDATVILIAHRLTTTHHCDRILLMHQGRVLADGTYDELLRTHEIFRQMATPPTHAGAAEPRG